MLDLAGVALLWWVARDERHRRPAPAGAASPPREAPCAPRSRPSSSGSLLVGVLRVAGRRPRVPHLGRPGRRRAPRREPGRRPPHLQRAGVGGPRRRAGARRGRQPGAGGRGPRRRRRGGGRPRSPTCRTAPTSISYRVISADGHPVRGGSVFGVGDVEVDTGALGPGGRRRRRPDVGGRRRRRAAASPTPACCWPPAASPSSCSCTAAGPSAPCCVRIVRAAAVVGAVGQPRRAPGAGGPRHRAGPRLAVRRRCPRRGGPGRRRRSACVLALVGLAVAVALVDRQRWRRAGRRGGRGDVVRHERAHPGGIDGRRWPPPPTSRTCSSSRRGEAGSCCCTSPSGTGAAPTQTTGRHGRAGRAVLDPGHRDHRGRGGHRVASLGVERGALARRPHRHRATGGSCS